MKLVDEVAQKYSSFVSKSLVSFKSSSAAISTVLLSSLSIATVIALLFSSQANAQTPTPLTATRASSFTYNAQGLLLTETIEPDSPQSCLVTTYGYDTYDSMARRN